MNNKISIRNNIVKIISIIVVVILASAIAAGVIYLTKKTTLSQLEYSIIVDDDITVYDGETFTLVPYLVNSDGTVEESRFDYTASDSSISVSVDGVISINSIPQEDVYVDIYERNTSTTAKVKVNVVGKLAKVLGFTFSDLEGNKVLVSGTQQLRLGETYVINVVTEPRNVEIERYCLFNALNSSGIEKEVFELTYDKTDVSMKVVGLGEGKVNINIENDAKQSIYKTDFDFSISMNDDLLSQEILSSCGATLLSKGELSEIETVELSRNISSLDGLHNLQSLKTVVFTSDEVMDVSNISADYCYRIKEGLFETYLTSEIWADYLKNIIPYEENAEEVVKDVYVVYHNLKTTSGEEEITYAKLSDIIEFPIYNYIGYIHTTWLDERGIVVSIEQLKEEVSENGIHLYACWKPISYTVIYHVRDYAETCNQFWYYDEEGSLYEAKDVVPSVERTGYKFAGWTKNASSGIYSSNIQYKKGETVSNLTTIDGDKIDLYDIWEPIEYTISFKTVDDMNPIEDLIVKYNTAYTLPKPSLSGYEFVSWQLQGSDKTFSPGVKNPNADKELNLAYIEGAEVILEPVFEEIKYTIIFDLNGGTCVSNPEIVDGWQVELRFTEEYTLPTLVREGYTTYNWRYNNNINETGTFGGTDRIFKTFVEACTVTFTANWTEAVYTVNYECDGGSIGEGSLSVSRAWNDGLSLAVPTKTGFTFTGWQDTERGVIYTEEDAAWSGNLISSAEESGAVFNLIALWDDNYYTLTITQGAGTSLTVKVGGVTMSNGATYSVKYNSEILVSFKANTGYESVKCTYTYGTSNISLSNGGLIVMPARSITISTSATQTVYKVSKSNGTNGSQVTIKYSTSNTYTYGSTVSFSLSVASGYKDAKVDSVVDADGNSITTTGSYSFTMPASNVTIKVSCADDNSCFIEGTLITLADGSTKPVEELKLGDSILSYDHFKGRYESAAISLLFAKEVVDYPILNLNFDNGSKLQVVNMHGLFDCDLNEYVMFDYFNASEYIGHTFVSVEYVNGNAVSVPTKLVSADVTYMTTTRYTLVTAYNINHVANGLLAVSDETEGLYNVFDYGDNMQYDEASIAADVEKYGLADYSDWSEYLTYEEYLAFNGQYINIALAKKLTTREKLVQLINTYVYDYGRV
ncbi:MAG: InlB B-repeat-containing protein [Candidatus Coproplasma sp.]